MPEIKCSIVKRYNARLSLSCTSLGWEGESFGLTSLTLSLTRKDEDTLPMDDGETACRLPPPGSAGSSSSARRAARVAHNLRVPLPSARVVHARQRREYYAARAGRN